MVLGVGSRSVKPIFGIALVAVLLTACDEDKRFADLNCSDIEQQAEDASKGELLAINNRTLTSRDENHVVCHGFGIFKHATDHPIRFQALLDDDGERIYEYDSDEYDAHQAYLEKQEEMREEQRDLQKIENAQRAAEREIQQEADKAELDAKAEMMPHTSDQ